LKASEEAFQRAHTALAFLLFLLLFDATQKELKGYFAGSPPDHVLQGCNSERIERKERRQAYETWERIDATQKELKGLRLCHSRRAGWKTMQLLGSAC